MSEELKPQAGAAQSAPDGYVLNIEVEKLLCEKLGIEWAPTGMSIVSLVDRLAQRAQSAPDDSHSFKNFHRLLCERFGYTHDEKDWRRDQLSLIEHIAAQSAPVVPEGWRIERTPDGAFCLSNDDHEHRSFFAPWGHKPARAVSAFLEAMLAAAPQPAAPAGKGGLSQSRGYKIKGQSYD